MKKNYYGFFLGVVSCIIAGAIVFIGYNYYQERKNIQEKNRLAAAEAKKPKLIALTTEKIFEKNQDAVVLIKHSFVYKINIDGKDFFFRDYNASTGEISEFISYDEAKANPNVSWGTGFFIDKMGTMLTNRHVVDVRPSEQEQKMILTSFKEKFQSYYYAYREQHYENEQELQQLKYRLDNGYYNDNYEQSSLISNYNSRLENYRSESIELDDFLEYIENFDSKKNYVTKTSIQFGVFFNNQISSTMNDYVQYKSVKISENPEVDLALMKPVNAQDLQGKKFVATNMSKIDSTIVKPLKITQKVVMLGYNMGNVIGVTAEGVKPQVTEGNISQMTDQNKLLYTIPAMPGSSGSPIFDKFGRVVAVNFAGMTGTQSFNYGIQTQQLANFLKGTK